jgi:hypothetical protein
MDPEVPGTSGDTEAADVGGTAAPVTAPVPAGTVGVMPNIREHVPSLIFGAALPLAVYFAVRSHVHTDAQALIVAGCFSVGWILIQFARQRRVDVVGAIVLFGFVVGVVCSTLLGGNAYVLKVREAVFTFLFGIVLIVTLFTHDRPALFYVSRYLSAGTDPGRVAAFDRLHEVPRGRRTFRVLSVVWGIGLVVEASLRMTLADVLPTGTFLAISPVITATVIGSMVAFTALYSRRVQEAALAWAGSGDPPPGDAPGGGLPQIPFP